MSVTFPQGQSQNNIRIMGIVVIFRWLPHAPGRSTVNPQSLRSPFSSLSPASPLHAASVAHLSPSAASRIRDVIASMSELQEMMRNKNKREHHICLNDLLHPHTPHWLQTSGAAARIGLSCIAVCARTRTQDLFLDTRPNIGPYWRELQSPVCVLTAAQWLWKETHFDWLLKLCFVTINCLVIQEMNTGTKVEWIWKKQLNKRCSGAHKVMEIQMYLFVYPICQLFTVTIGGKSCIFWLWLFHLHNRYLHETERILIAVTLAPTVTSFSPYVWWNFQVCAK